MNRYFVLAALFFISIITLNHPAHAAEPAPQAGVENFINAIRSMKFPVAGAEDQKFVEDANAYLDLEALSKKALGPYWDNASHEERTAFLDLMWKLIENVAYPKSHRFMGNYQITYPDVKPSGSGYEIHSVVKQEEKGLDADVLYHVNLQGEVWKIDDVILDGVSITEDLKYQFDKIIEESKFAGLLESMQKRLADAQTENQTAST